MRFPIRRWCQRLILLTVVLIVGRKVYSSYTQGKIERLQFSNALLDERGEPWTEKLSMILRNTSQLNSNKRNSQIYEMDNKTKVVLDVPQPGPQRRLDLSFTGIYTPPRSNLIKAYHNILNAALGNITFTYEEPKTTPYEDRRHAQNMCNLLPGSNKGTNSTLRHLWYSKELKLIYCPATKTGSTFWRRTWNALSVHSVNVTSPYQFSYEDFNEHMIDNINEKDGTLNYIFDTSLKFMFTRNPYTRIFSGYVDKILAPNTFFWPLSRKIIANFRTGASEKSLRCGHDLTFSEFIKYIINVPAQQLEPHFKPVSEVCDVCSLQYDVIGKMETFKDDALYILNKVGVLDNRIKFKDFEMEHTVDSIVDLVTRAYEHKHLLEQCMSYHVALRRLWRQFQVAGTIAKEEEYPLTPEESLTVSRMRMSNLVIEAYQRTTSKTKQNRKEAFLLAYQKVSSYDLELLMRRFKNDFMLFGYGERPKELFDKSDQPIIDFDFFDVLSE